MSLPYLQPYLGLSNGLNTLHGGAVGGGVGGWVELARTTLGSSSDNITVSSLPDKRYYMVLMHDIPTGNTQWFPRLGYGSVDSGSNYSTRESNNGGADVTVTSYSSLRWNTGVTTSYNTQKFGVGYIANYASKEKLSIFNGVAQNTAGATTAPQRAEHVSKWAQTTNPLNIVNLNNIETGDYNTGSEVVVLGYDPADTHTNNFWEELASVNGTGDQTATFTAKKYLWVQIYRKGTLGMSIRVGNSSIDTGNNYASRYSNDGGADTVTPSYSGWLQNWEYDTLPSFTNIFIVNNASNEKLAYGYRVWQRTAGATTAPSRGEFALKWSNTSNQIDRIQSHALSGTIGTNIIKVWGAD